MFVLEYMLVAAGAAAILLTVAWTVREVRAGHDPDWRRAGKLAALGLLPLLLGLSIQVVPSGMAGVRVSQLSGALPGTLYPGTHFIVPMIQSVAVYPTRDNVYQTVTSPDPKTGGEVLKVQTREGLSVSLALAVRYKIDSRRLHHVHTNLPQPLEKELVPPVVASVFREIAPNYSVRELFSTKREDIRRAAAGSIAKRLEPDAIFVTEVMLRDVLLPAEYAKGLEGLLLKEQENERLTVEMELKVKQVRTAELEAEAVKARQVKQAEADASVTVLQAKAQSDAMQYTLPLKEKQIQQTRLEAEARKESTVKQAEAAAQAKVIDGKAELERRKLLNEADLHRVQLMAKADTDKMRLEAAVLKESPLLIQKIVAEKLSDKVQIMMVPNDGKYFFANDVLRGGAPSGTIPLGVVNQQQ